MGLSVRIAVAAGLIVGAVAGVTCATGGEGADVPRPDVVDARDDGAAGDGGDAGDAPDAHLCDASSQCDDGIDCTDDFCGAGGVCAHEPLHDRCPEGQRCNARSGCGGVECTADADCSNGLWCDGDETCIANRCFRGERSCDDGNPCTEDYCNEATAACVRVPLDIEGCEYDGGDDEASTVPFDPAVHYSGTFDVFPIQSSDCVSGASYNLSSIRISSSGSELSISGPPCTMTQAPVPATADFSVSCQVAACATYALTGRFVDANEFSGRWSASFWGGMCTICSPQDADVYGVRR